VKLGDVITIQHGYAFPGVGFSDDPELPNLVTPGNFSIGGGFKRGKVKTFAGEYPKSYELSAGDLVVSMTDLSKAGDTLGTPALVPAGKLYLHNQRVGLVTILDPSLVDRAFLNYAMRVAAYRSYVVGTASGSTVRHTSPTKICEFVMTTPPVLEQQAIADVLGALDDKIAANRKLADTAGELSQALFNEAASRPCASEVSFADLAAVTGGGTPRTSVPEYWEGEINWATPTDVTALSAPYLRSTSRLITEAGLSNCSSSLYRAGSILMTSRATIGAFALTEVPTAVNQGFIVVNAHDPVHQMWLFHEMRSRVAEFISLANGATFLELSRGRFKTLKVRLPEREVLERFDDQVSALHRSAALASFESESLTNLRDTLLPQLMAGKVRVRDAVSVVEDAV
jgi:type I restriction enzyme S subunit